MKELLAQVREHLRADYDPVLYGFTAVLLVSLLVGHYGLGGLQVLGPRDGSLAQYLRFTSYYAVPWALVIGVAAMRGRLRPDVGFVLSALVGLGALGLLEWWPFHDDVMRQIPREARPWLGGIAWWFKGIAAYMVPLALFWLVWDRRRIRPFYGWSLSTFEPRPYLGVALGLILIAGVASFEPSFQSYYPSYRPGRAEAWLGVSPWLTVPVYEVVYGLQFAAVETFFRGFFVVGMARWLGRTAVIPMITVYCVLHLGKPFGEALTSIFGGYCLGVWAYRNRCMIEGILLHVSLAWAMDGFALLQRALR